MKHMYQDSIKPFLREQILATAKELNLTTEQTAELLAIDARSYAYLKAGKYACSATTLIVYLTKMCPDPVKFIEDARIVVTAAEETPLP